MTSAMTPVVGAPWLWTQLQSPGEDAPPDPLLDPPLVVVDCRFSLADPQLGQRQYAEAHIPSARYLDLEQHLSGPIQPQTGRHPLPAVAQFSQTLAAIGIQLGKTRVVAYDDSKGAFAARLWWLLGYLGHDAVAVLDGGWQSWLAQGYDTATGAPDPLSSPATHTPVPAPRTDWVVDRAQVKLRSHPTRLIDSRAPERYRGEVEPIDPVAGHIPGAENAFWQAVIDDQGKLRSQPELQQHWQQFGPTDQAIVYCGSGVTACVNLLSQAVAGYPLSKLYVGGWSEWCRQPED
jgi:thiosulfate/3-mercaptopyruvate sulfurtransferase